MLLRLIQITLWVKRYGLFTGGGGLVTKSCPTLTTPWTVTRQVPLFMGFSRQEYCSGLPFPSPGDLPDPGMEPWSPVSQADSLSSELQGKTGLLTNQMEKMALRNISN